MTSLPPGIRPNIREQDPVKSAMEQFEWILRQVKWKYRLEGDRKHTTDEQLAALLNMNRMTIVRARNDMNDILAGRPAPLPATPVVMHLAMLCRPPLANQAQFYDFMCWYECLEKLYQRAYEMQPRQYGTITEQRAVARAERRKPSTDELTYPSAEQRQQMIVNR